MLALWVVVLALIWLLQIFLVLAVNAVLPFVVLQTLALILMELELHSLALLLHGLHALILPLHYAQGYIALKEIAVFHCVVLTLNVIQATLQERVPQLFLAHLALARMTFAAQELCARLPTLASVLSISRNLTSQPLLALDQLALIRTAAETNVRTSCVMRALRRTVISIVLVSHARTPSAVRHKLNVLLTTRAPHILVMY